MKKQICNDEIVAWISFFIMQGETVKDKLTQLQDSYLNNTFNSM